MTQFTRMELPCGIRCVLRRNKSHVAYCGLTIGTGSRDESITEHGIAHLVEHSLFKGTAKRTAYHINNRLERLGGDLNAFTTKEETVIHAASLKGDFSKAAELISDIAFNATLLQREVDKEKEIITDEINSYRDNPQERIFDDYEDMLFDGSSLGHNILGDKRSIVKFSSQDLRGFIDRTYNTDRMVFSCVGDISERRFRDVCERYFSVPENTRAFTRESPAAGEPFSRTAGKRGFQSHCIMGGRAYSNTDERRIALALLVNMLGGASANSILNTSVRERNGLSYNVEAGYTALADTGIATVYFSSDSENVEKCIELINIELRKAASGAISSRQLSAAKKQFVGQLYISTENNEGNMLAAGKSILTYDNVEDVKNIAKRIGAVSESDIASVAEEIFGGRLSTLIYR